MRPGAPALNVADRLDGATALNQPGQKVIRFASLVLTLDP
jgi:hypothetical protein